MSYTTLKVGISLFLIFYFFAGVYAHTLPGNEIYPFFSWFLFYKIPGQVQSEYAIRILEHQGEKLQPPLFFDEADALISQTNNSPTEYWVIIEELARSIERNDDEAIKRSREILEENFLSTPIRYEVVQIEFNPIEYWKTRKIMNLRTIGIFTTQN